MNKIGILTLSLILTACAMPEQRLSLPITNASHNVTVDDSMIGNQVFLDTFSTSGNYSYPITVEPSIGEYVAQSLNSETPVTVIMKSITARGNMHFSGQVDYSCQIVSSLNDEDMVYHMRYSREHGLAVMIDEITYSGITECLDQYSNKLQKSIDSL
ncbi:hypothetical protein RSX27_003425 [Vibrio parahaemolyticus]|nr:hypothetical protein [Vibrio parahaemolyticus]